MGCDAAPIQCLQQQLIAGVESTGRFPVDQQGKTLSIPKNILVIQVAVADHLVRRQSLKPRPEVPIERVVRPNSGPLRMTDSAPTPSTIRRVLVAVAVAAALMFTSSPVAAQYGSGVELIVVDTRVEIEGTFAYAGMNCPAGSTVTITIDGFPGVIATTVAFGDGSYAGTGATMPDGVVAGQDYTVRASCGGESDTAVVRAVCNGGTDPVNGRCPDGRIIGGQDGNPTTTTTRGSGSGGGAVGDRTGSNPDLAVTGASFAEQIAQVGITLVSLGALVVLLAGRRRDHVAV